MNIWIQILITLIIVAIFFYFSVGFIVSWMNAEIFKSAGVGKLHWALNLVTLLIWPSMIKETLSGFKDTMALEIGKIAAAKSASSGGDSTGGLGSMLGAMAGGLAGAAVGGPANDTPESDRIVETN